MTPYSNSEQLKIQKEQPDIKSLSLSEFKYDVQWKAHLKIRKLGPIKNVIFYFEIDQYGRYWIELGSYEVGLKIIGKITCYVLFLFQ